MCIRDRFWGPCGSARPGTHYVTKRQTTQGCNDTGGACDVYPHPRAHDPTFRRCTATLDRAVDPTRSCSPGDRGVEPTAGDTGDPDPPCRAPCNHIDPTGTVSYTHLRAHETDSYLVCRLLLE